MSDSNVAVTEVATLLVPVDGKTLLIPNVTVAEVLNYIEPEDQLVDGPEWHLGYLEWRMQKIPVVSFEGLNGAGVSSLTGSENICVLNGSSDAVPFFAVLAQGSPRLMRVDAETFKAADGALGDVETMKVEGAANMVAIIPDLTKIEREIASATE